MADVLIKICGLREPAYARAAVDAGADFLGVVFAESPRRISVEGARAIRALLGPRLEIGGSIADAVAEAVARARDRAGQPLLVGVFAGQSADEINRISVAANLDLVQLSGGEPAALAAELPRPALRVLHVGPDTAAAALLAEARQPPATITMLDTQTARHGGSGVPFDWDVARAVAAQRPLMLAGGLTPANVAEAVGRVRPWAVDVSSGVETDGRKDPDKITAFISAARGLRTGSTP